MKKGISPMVATAILIAFTVGITWVVSDWFEEHYPIKDEKWTCVEWRNETTFYYSDNSSRIGYTLQDFCNDWKTGGYPNRTDIVNCETKQTCIKEGLNCRNETKNITSRFFDSDKYYTYIGLECGNGKFHLFLDKTFFNNLYYIYDINFNPVNFTDFVCKPYETKTVCEKERDVA